MVRLRVTAVAGSGHPSSAASLLTLEDNYEGGFGSAVADCLVEYGGPFTLKQLSVRQIPESGRTPDDVLRHLGLSVEDILKAAIESLAFIATYRSWERRKALAL